MSETDRAAGLGTAMEAAETDGAVLEALARAIWHNKHDGAECPDNRLPEAGDLGRGDCRGVAPGAVPVTGNFCTFLGKVWA